MGHESDEAIDAVRATVSEGTATPTHAAARSPRRRVEWPFRPAHGDTEVTRPPRLGSRSARLELGLMAFSPAMALLAARARDDLLWVVVFGVPALLGVIVAVVAARLVRKGNPEPFVLESIEDASDEVVGHVGSYLLPVVVDIGGSTEQAVIAAIALALIIQIHIATGRVHVNPLLYVFGYRTYRATSSTGVAYYLIASTDVGGWDGSHRLVPLGASLLVEPRQSTGPQGIKQ